MKQSKYRSLLFISCLTVALTVSACGSPGSTSAPAPNTGNIPQLTTRPTPQSSALKKMRFSGKVFDSVTGEVIDQATIWIQAIDPASATPASAAPGNNTSAPLPATPPPVATPPPASAAPPASATPPVSATPPPPGPPVTAPPGTTTSPPPILPAALAPGEGWLWGVGAQAASPSAGSQDNNLFRTTTNNQGKFWLNDVPEGVHTITIQAPQYRTLTLTQVNAAAQLELPLTPINALNSSDLVGMVLSPADTPVSLAHVSPSSLWGEATGIPSQSNDLGEFLLPELPFGKHVLVAFVMNENYVIQQLGISDDFNITAKSVKSKRTAFSADESVEPKLPSEPRTDPEKRKELEDNVENILKATPVPEKSAEVEPDTVPSAESSASASPESSAKPAPEASADSKSKPIAAPNTPPSTPVENEEESADKNKPFNLFSAVSELVTGKKGDEEESTKDGSVYPVITLRSVLSDFKLEGKVNIPTGYDYRGLEVYLALAVPKNDPPQEVLLFNLPGRKTAKPTAADDSKEKPSASATAAPAAPDASLPESQDFSLRLPVLEKGQSYHLQFTAAAKKTGSLLYQHTYEIGEKNEKPIEATFLPATASIEIEGEEDNNIPTSPAFAWEPVPGAEYYRVVLEAGSAPENKVIWEAWCKETQIVFPLRTSSGRLKEGELYTVSVAALKGLKPAQKNSKVTYAHPGYQAIWTELSTLTRKPFEVVKTEL
jgi:hypothetical protein